MSTEALTQKAVEQHNLLLNRSQETPPVHDNFNHQSENRLASIKESVKSHPQRKISRALPQPTLHDLSEVSRVMPLVLPSGNSNNPHERKISRTNPLHLLQDISESSKERKISRTNPPHMFHDPPESHSLRKMSRTTPSVWHHDQTHPERKTSRAMLTNDFNVLHVLNAARTWKRLSQRTKTVSDRPVISMENTYQLGPDRKFNPREVEGMLEILMNRLLVDFWYTPENSKQMCLYLSSEIKARVQQLNLPRYKIVCHVQIAENQKQGIAVTSRCVWSPDTDSFASFTYKSARFVCVAVLYAVYYE